jgi:hypothetical protein
MKRRVLFGLALIGALLVPLSARSDIPTLTYGPVALTASTNLATLNLSGQSSCSMVLSGSGSATLTPKGSSDGGTTFTTVSSIGAQTANGTYGAAISPYLTNFYIAVTGVTGTVNVTEACSAAFAGSSGGGGGAVSSVGGVNNVVVSPTTGAVVVSLTPNPNVSGLIVAPACTPNGTCGGVLGTTPAPTQIGRIELAAQVGATYAPFLIQALGSGTNGAPALDIYAKDSTGAFLRAYEFGSDLSGTGNPFTFSVFRGDVDLNSGFTYYTGDWAAHVLLCTGAQDVTLGSPAQTGCTGASGTISSLTATNLTVTGTCTGCTGSPGVTITAGPSPAPQTTANAAISGSFGSGRLYLLNTATSPPTYQDVFLASANGSATPAPNELLIHVNGAYYTYDGTAFHTGSNIHADGSFFEDSSWNGGFGTCTNASAQLIECVTATDASGKNVGLVSCTLSSLTCTTSAISPGHSGARCQATIDADHTTASLALILAPAYSVTSKTFTFNALAAASGTVAANYWCP